MPKNINRLQSGTLEALGYLPAELNPRQIVQRQRLGDILSGDGVTAIKIRMSRQRDKIFQAEISAVEADGESLAEVLSYPPVENITPDKKSSGVYIQSMRDLGDQGLFGIILINNAMLNINVQQGTQGLEMESKVPNFNLILQAFAQATGLTLGEIAALALLIQTQKNAPAKPPRRIRKPAASAAPEPLGTPEVETQLTPPEAQPEEEAEEKPKPLIVIGLAGYRLPQEISSDFLTHVASSARQGAFTEALPDYSLTESNLRSLQSSPEYQAYQDFLQTIFNLGISEDQLAQGLANLRTHYIAFANLLEESNHAIAQAIARRANADATKHPEGLAATVPIVRLYLTHVKENLLEINPEYDVEETGALNPLFIPHDGEMIEDWMARYTPGHLQEYRKHLEPIAAKNQTARLLLELIDAPNAAELLSTLRHGNDASTIALGDNILSRRAADMVLAPIIMPEELMLRALFEDVVRKAFELETKRMPVELFDLMNAGIRRLVDEFSASEITQLLTAPTSDVSIDEAIKQAKAAYERIRPKSTGARRAKQSLEVQQLEDEWKLLVQLKRNGYLAVPAIAEVSNRIKDKIKVKIPPEPDPQDFASSGESYISAKERYSTLSETYKILNRK